MKDMRQILLIAQSLNKVRSGYIDDLTQLNKLIATKTTVRKKMILYQNEYRDTSKFSISQSSAALSKNLHLFTKKIELAVRKVDQEIDGLENRKQSIIQKIESLDKKIEMMAAFENKVKASNLQRDERKEQALFDAITTTKHIRGEYE